MSLASRGTYIHVYKPGRGTGFRFFRVFSCLFFFKKPCSEHAQVHSGGGKITSTTVYYYQLSFRAQETVGEQQCVTGGSKEVARAIRTVMSHLMIPSRAKKKPAQAEQVPKQDRTKSRVSKQKITISVYILCTSTSYAIKKKPILEEPRRES